MKNLTLKQFRYIDALARHGHFGLAAADCAVSQPALSMQVQEIERELGVTLFDRAPRRVRPTRVGEEVVARARAILRQVEDLGEVARAAQGRLAGRLRLGVIPTIAPYLLPGVIRAIGAGFPGLEVALRETLTPRLVEELAEGRLDAAILALPVGEKALTEVPLFDEDFVLIRPAAEADAPVPGPRALKEMKLLLLEEGHCFRDQALEYCTLDAARPREVMDASSLSTLVQMVGSGMGVTLLPEMAVAVETRAAEVSVARFPRDAPSRRIGMVWRRSSPLETQLREVAEVVRSVHGSG